MSAIATLMGLMLFVTFLANFVIQPLPDQIAQLEYQHDLKVRDQMLRLAATVRAEIAHANIPYSLSSPVTLGSLAQPPFGPPSAGQVSLQPLVIRASARYALEQVIFAPPKWNTGSNCLNGTPPGSGQCSANSNVEFWNVSAVNNTVFPVKIVGGNNSLQYNLSANNDTINIQWSGKDIGYLTVVVNGSNNVVNFTKQSADNRPTFTNFYFFGQNDTFNFFPPSSTTKNPMTVHVQFIGELTRVCPAGTLSHTDKVDILGPGKNLLNVTVTWWNASGVPSDAQTLYPPGNDATSTVTWQNRSGSVLCAFYLQPTENLSAQSLSGVNVHLSNRYIPPTDFSFAQGAVIEQQLGGRPQMLSPPIISFATSPAGKSASITLVNLIGAAQVEGGLETAAVSTHVVSFSQLTVVNQTNDIVLGSQIYLNITTTYPAAWTAFFNRYPGYLQGGVSCFPTQPLSLPATCLAPPPTVPVMVSVTIDVSKLVLTVATIQVSLA